MKALFPLLLLGVLAACQKDQIEVRRVPKEAAAPAMAGEAPKPAGLRWTAPKGWTELPGEGMRAASFVPPPAAGKAEVTVLAFPGDAGGELANVNRWRGQISLAPVAEKDLAGLRARVRSPAGTALVYDFTGGGTPPTRVVAAMIRVGGMTWFFKLTGEEKAVAADKAAFLRLLGSLKTDAA